MKKFNVILGAAVIFAAIFTGCKKSGADNVITVGATPEPHAAILNLLAEDLAKEGITLKVVEFTDYVIPNEAVESGKLDANFFQHAPYMDTFNKEKKYHLVNVAGIHIEPLALYSEKYTSIEDIPDGAVIAIPNDPTNEGRALLLLQSAGFITLDADAGLTAVPSDVTENTKNIKFHEVEAPSLPRVLADVDAAVINGNYAIPAGLAATKDGLIVEGADSPYVNILVAKDGRQDEAKIQALAKAMTSEKVKEYIQNTYKNGEVIAVF